MSFHVIIPARLASTRLPQKPLKMIAGKSMIQRVYEQAKLSSASSVTIATDSAEIEAHVKSFDGRVIMTAESHLSGTDRLQEAAQQLGLVGDEVVVNVQGDEPLIPPEVIDQVAHLLIGNASASAATLSEPIDEVQTLFDPNAVKVVSDLNRKVLYFSRAPIPWSRDTFGGAGDKSATLENLTNLEMPSNNIAQRHIGIYAYRVKLLNDFVTWQPAALEQIEKLEQLRIMANGYDIYVDTAAASVPGGVDTEEDLKRVCEYVERSIA